MKNTGTGDLDDRKPIEKPERPADDECCGGGCSPCVWDRYNDQLSRWLEQQGRPPLKPFSEEDDSLYR
ncbi:MAG: oxidoreductase-like domain-containing protein [Endozoicomonas sp.]